VSGVDQHARLFLAFIAQNFDLIVQNFYAFFHLSQVLAQSLDFSDVSVTAILDFLEESDEWIELEFLLLKLLGEVKNQELFDFELLFCFTGLGRSLGGSTCHLLTNGRQKFDFLLALGHRVVKHFDLVVWGGDLGLDCCNFSVDALIFNTFLDELADENLLLFLQVILRFAVLFSIYI